MESTYDLVISGGRIIDPAENYDEIGDLAVDSGKIARIAPTIDRSFRFKVYEENIILGS